MKPEIEVKFSNVNFDQLRKKLKAVGAVCAQPMRLMKRALIEETHHAAEHAFIRIRDEGDKITLTFKRRADSHASTIDGTKELEVEVSDFEKTVEIFAEAGWKYITFQESKRETWKLNNVEIVLDEWPWLEPYIEIEGESEEEIRVIGELLNLDWREVIIGHVDTLYERQYEFLNGVRGVIDVPEVRFNEPLPVNFRPRKSKK